MKYHLTSDPGHGWLHVKRAELERLGIAGQITSCSYQRGAMTYLEEDRDMTTFIRAKRALREPVEWVAHYCDYTPIRGYARFQREVA